MLLEGFPAQKLVAIVENIIDSMEDTHLVQANKEGDLSERARKRALAKHKKEAFPHLVPG